MNQSFELAKLYFERCDFQQALPILEDLAKDFEGQGKIAQALECQNILLRIYAEQEDHEKISRLKLTLTRSVEKAAGSRDLNSKSYYTLALCSAYVDQVDLALEYLQKALSIALSTDSKVDMCYAICGLAIVYNRMGRYADALKEIYNLQVFFQVIHLPELKLSAQIINGKILRNLGKTDEALSLFWECFEVLKTHKSLLMYLYVLFELGETYLKMGQSEEAFRHFQLAERSVDAANMKYFSRQLQERIKKINLKHKEEFDLFFDETNHLVTEVKIGKVDFKNQFILLDLLKLFVSNPGVVFTKEDLVMKVWHQDYDPMVHDNKIYVTIKRLRKMIEPDYEKPKYIFRSKNGYYLNKAIKVVMNQ